ncbi:peptidyl-prolyl cis-trans isomerase-like [Plutella xylostella]|uniref:peptidyl-prolyl cis-trans isomerase-like n=1 Tax=Plutella xylostella TaxID=51655 RepID=UPI00203256AE|nr:peptidyl-prolyl cis-trans isomerase-like [Plutella xylostella]
MSMVHIELRVQDGCSLGWLQLELFADVCPRTCRLFLELNLDNIVHLELRVQDGCSLGWLQLELFADVCPATCRLFLELLTAGTDTYSYINSIFFRKVPHLYWSGGDVVYNNGCGCYAQRGRRRPIGAENYTYAHSVPGRWTFLSYPPGLLSMRVTRDDEVCGIFNITFKPMPQFDLQNVVFGRVVRPSSTYEAMRSLGAPLSARPLVYIAACKI